MYYIIEVFIICYFHINIKLCGYFVLFFYMFLLLFLAQQCPALASMLFYWITRWVCLMCVFYLLVQVNHRQQRLQWQQRTLTPQPQVWGKENCCDRTQSTFMIVSAKTDSSHHYEWMHTHTHTHPPCVSVQPKCSKRPVTAVKKPEGKGRIQVCLVSTLILVLSHLLVHT